MQLMMRPASITFPIATLRLGWCIGIALLEQPHGIGYALTRHCLMIFVLLAPWLTLKLTFYVIVSLGRKFAHCSKSLPASRQIGHALGIPQRAKQIRQVCSEHRLCLTPLCFD